MTSPPDKRPATPGTPATSPDTPAATAKTDGERLSNNERWDADEEPWRHPPVAPKDESVAESLGRSVSDAIVSAADEGDTPGKTPKPRS